MAVRFTDEQLQAIETLDKSILVSAAAGSGKTAVLVERIIRIILEGEANVDEMLVVTFTKAAAAEMRVRLSAKIRERMKDHPEERPRLRDQLGRMYKAYISTIDSFALRVIREFFYETDIEPDFGTCDEVQGELLRREAAAELFEYGFENDDFIETGIPDGEVGFREFLRLYSEERSEDRFKEDLMRSYASLRSMPDYFSWAYSKAENLRVTAEDFASSELHDVMTEDAAYTFRIACDAAARVERIMTEAGLREMFRDKLAAETEEIREIRSELERGILDEAMMERIAGISYQTLRSTKATKEAYDPVKTEIKDLRDTYKKEIRGWTAKYLQPDFDARLREQADTYKYTVYYIRLLEEFEKRYAEKKRERRVMDFADMEHNAVRILSNEAAASVLRKRFRFIFVDEDQDTNNIQEYLISKVARPDNVFRVGDVKQSIYKFRQAEPGIFERLYRRLSRETERDGITIDLSRNFRSNDATIRYINTVFESVMDGYDERARLYTGCSCRPEYDFVPEVHILTDDGDVEVYEEDEEAAGDAVDAEIEDLSKEEAEAAYIADIARSLIGTEFEDTKTGEIRKASARDIVILFRAVRVRGDIMARALRQRGIEPHIEEDDNYFDTVEISVALSLLTCIDNMKRDIPLIATLHSEVFGWTPEELARVRMEHSRYLRELEEEKRGAAGNETEERRAYIRPAYWEALEWYYENGGDDELRGKAAHVRDSITGWRRMSRMMPLADFVWKVLTGSGYYRMAGAMNGGARRQANLRVLADRAAKYSSETVSSLSSYISFLDVMRKKNISNGQARTAGSDDDVVRISTIHKSKGLEYPFVIVGGLGHRFRFDTNEKKFSFDSEIGVGMPYIDPARKYWRSTMIQRAINAKSYRDSMMEELRVLYVAMTRARNKLILVGTVRDEESLAKYAARPSSYLQVMRDVLATPCNTYRVTQLERRASAVSGRMGSLTDTVPETLSEEAQKIYEEIDRRFGYRYPDEELLTVKAKYSVSEIRREELEASRTADMPRDDLPAEPDSGEEVDTGADAGVHSADNEVVRLWSQAEEHKKASAADIGIAYHRIMEYLDFARAGGVSPNSSGDTCGIIGAYGAVDTEYIEESARYLAEQGAVDQDAYRYVDLDRIAEFFRSDIGRRAAAAAAGGKLRKEKPFTLRTNRNGRDILVQGVIDCCFEEDGRMILIDYKSSYIRQGRQRAQEIERIRSEYRVQIELYSEAIRQGTGMEVGGAYLYLFSTGEAIRL